MMSALLLALILNITYTDYCTVTVSIWSDLSQLNGLLDYAIYDWMDDTGRNATTVNNGR